MRVALVALLLLSIPGLAFSQPRAARVAIPLPVAAKDLAAALGLPSSDAATILVDAVRLVHTLTDTHERQRAAAALARALDAPVPATPPEIVPLPLEPDIWREAILGAQVADDRLVAAILRDRTASLIYLGLSALDEETLAWLGSHRESLQHLRKHPALFAAFGRSIRIRAGRVAVPGGADAEPLWRAVSGADAGDPAAFIARVWSGDGRLAFLYDTIAHLDEAHQRFALGLYLPPPARTAALRALLRAFQMAAPDWRADERPFSRPPIDGAMLLSAIAVRSSGRAVPPIDRRLWQRVFSADALIDVSFETVSAADIAAASKNLSVDAAWLAARILDVPYAVGRRRLDMLLFAQRVFAPLRDPDPALVATSLRGYAAFPALLLALERIGVTSPATFAAAATHAARLGAVDALPIRRTSIAEFQSAVALIQRGVSSGALDAARAERLIVALSSLDVSSRDGYGPRFSRWLRDELVAALPANRDGSIEGTVLAAMAGVSAHPSAAPQITWEERAYRVDPAAAELRRLRLVRERQRGASLDIALTTDGALADALVALVYALYLGDPGAAAVTSGNVSARHDFGLAAVPSGSAAAWRLPVEDFDRRAAWRVHGSLLGLEAALSRLTLRRVNAADMPAEPKVGPQDRQTVMLTVGLLDPLAMTDASRDEIVAALRRGRARVQALTREPGTLDDVVWDAGLSEWRRQGLAWTLARRGEGVAGRFSLLELLWLGYAGREMPPSLDAWGAAALPLTGCLCLRMPRPRAWEEDAGHASALLGTRAADVNLRIAEVLAETKLPAALAPALAGYAMQDVLEHAQLAHADDWSEFGRAARELPLERMFDYIAALATGGPLVPITKDGRESRNP